jgi:hypothetical protein
MRSAGIALSIVIAAVAFAASNRNTAAQEAAAANSGVTVARWQWLKGTTWIVPANAPPNGYQIVNGKVIVPVPDQTVYQINDYKEGFFWGKLVKSLKGTASCLSMIGSVTPEGWIHMSLVTQDLSNVSRGTGIMRLRNGAWTMEWQGTSGPSPAAQYTHWSYMTLTRPGLPTWNNLPIVHKSVPAFMAQCPGTGPHLPSRR